MYEKQHRHWQNWDNGNAAEVIDDYWTSSALEAEARKCTAEDIRDTFGECQPIFEVGCGSGLMARSLIEAGATNETLYSGGDVSLSMLELARKRNHRLNVMQLDIFDLSPIGRRNNVICLHVLQHLPNYPEALWQLIEMAIKRLYIVTWLNETDMDEIKRSRDSAAEPLFYTNVYSRSGFIGTFGRLVGSRKVTIFAKHLISSAFAISAEFHPG